MPEGKIMIVTRFFKEKRLQTIKGSRLRELRFFFGKKKFYFILSGSISLTIVFRLAFNRVCLAIFSLNLIEYSEHPRIRT